MSLPTIQETRRATREELEFARSQALAHKWRHDMWMILRERPATVTELAEEIGVGRDRLNYHIRVLAGKEHIPYALIELIDTDRKRGGEQFIYKAIEGPHVDLETSEKLTRPIREAISNRIVPELIEDLEEAQRTGTMDDEELRNLVRFHEDYDEQGLREFAELADLVIERRKEIIAGVQNRKANDEVETIPVAFHLSTFKIPVRYRGGKPR